MAERSLEPGGEMRFGMEMREGGGEETKKGAGILWKSFLFLDFGALSTIFWGGGAVMIIVDVVWGWRGGRRAGRLLGGAESREEL